MGLETLRFVTCKECVNKQRTNIWRNLNFSIFPQTGFAVLKSHTTSIRADKRRNPYSRIIFGILIRDPSVDASYRPEWDFNSINESSNGSTANAEADEMKN